MVTIIIRIKLKYVYICINDLFFILAIILLIISFRALYEKFFPKLHRLIKICIRLLGILPQIIIKNYLFSMNLKYTLCIKKYHQIKYKFLKKSKSLILKICICFIFDPLNRKNCSKKFLRFQENLFWIDSKILVRIFIHIWNKIMWKKVLFNFFFL